MSPTQNVLIDVKCGPEEGYNTCIKQYIARVASGESRNGEISRDRGEGKM